MVLLTWAALLLAGAAIIMATIRIVHLRAGGSEVERRVRYNLAAVVSAALMLVTPTILERWVGQEVATWVGVGFAGLALGLLLIGERLQSKIEL